MKECQCSLRTRVVGDGCEVCNPELARWYDEQAAIDDAEEAAKEAKP